MGVHHVAVVPGIAVGLRGVQLAGRQHGVLRGVTHGVTVHRQLRLEAVVRAELLHLRERGGNHVRIQQTNVRDGRARRAQGTGASVDGRVVRGGLNLVQAVGVAGRINIALDKLRLRALLVRNHLETLHNPRVQATGHQRYDRQHCGANQRQTPVILHRGSNEHERHQQRRNRQDGAHGNGCVHVRVHGAGPASGLLLGGRVTVQPEAHRAGQNKHDGKHGRVAAESVSRGHAARLHLNAAVEVVHEQAGHRGERHGGGHQRHHHAQEGQHKHEEAVVQAEFRVGLAERLLVEEKGDRAPLRHRCRGNKQAQ